MNDLKSCPFCGGKAKMETWSLMLRDNPFYVVNCEDCGATTWPYVSSPLDALNLWNRRAEP